MEVPTTKPFFLASSSSGEISRALWCWSLTIDLCMTDRVFYESLLQQKPDSEMAQEWCLAYGVLPEEQAKKLYAKVCSRKGIKPVVQSSAIQSPVKKPAASGNGGRKRKVVVEGDLEGDDDLGASAVWEERGRIGV